MTSETDTAKRVMELDTYFWPPPITFHKNHFPFNLSLYFPMKSANLENIQKMMGGGQKYVPNGRCPLLTISFTMFSEDIFSSVHEIAHKLRYPLFPQYRYSVVLLKDSQLLEYGTYISMPLWQIERSESVWILN